MAARKKATPEPLPPFSPPSTVRCFAHADGRTYDLQVVDCRVYESWTNAGSGGGALPCTRPNDEEAQQHAWKKVQGLLKKGFVEGASRPGRVYDPDADVIDTMRSDLDYKGDPRDDFQPTADPHVFETRNVSSWYWAITSDDRRRAITLRSGVWQSSLPEPEREAMASALITQLKAKRNEIFADSKTPVRKLPLPTGIGRFDCLVVLSPTVTDQKVDGRFTICRSVYRAFPAFDCELREADSVTEAEARTSGRASLPYNTWDRAPHPVLDLAYCKTSTEPPEFLIYDPKQLEARLVKALPTLKVAEIRARNYRSEELRFVPGPAPKALTELRSFFGYAP